MAKSRPPQPDAPNPASRPTSRVDAPVSPFAASAGARAKGQRDAQNKSKAQAKPESSPRGAFRPVPPTAREIPGKGKAAAFGATISRRASERLRNGHLWVYATDVESVSAPNGETLLPVADNRGLLLGTALYSPASQIALRMVSNELIDGQAWLELLTARLQRAIALRLPFLASGGEHGSDSCRLCFSEADELPGLVVDKYGDLVVLQLLVKGLDSPAVRQAVVEVLRSYGKFFEPAAIWERPDPRIRELEDLSEPVPGPLFATHPDSPLTETTFQLNGLKFLLNVESGQKTGAFLDQRANYRAAKEYAGLLAPGGRALDVCTYQGGFALHLAQVSKHVTAIDASRASLEIAEQNLAANRDLLGDKEIEWVCGDAFEVLRDWASGGQQFDSIVLDPPAFAKSKRAVEGALRGYKELNLRALQTIRPGGLLVTCSCSHHVSGSDLEAAVASAAADAHRRVTLLERRGAAPDHPVVLNLPETEYLKCLICRID